MACSLDTTTHSHGDCIGMMCFVCRCVHVLSDMCACKACGSVGVLYGCGLGVNHCQIFTTVNLIMDYEVSFLNAIHGSISHYGRIYTKILYNKAKSHAII